MAVTAATVQKWGKLNNGAPFTGDDLTLMELVVAAVTGHVEKHFIVSDPMTDSQELAITMQCARLWRRRDTPEGVLAFGDLGAVRVSRLDPDVEEMLDRKVNLG